MSDPKSERSKLVAVVLLTSIVFLAAGMLAVQAGCEDSSAFGIATLAAAGTLWLIGVLLKS